MGNFFSNSSSCSDSSNKPKLSTYDLTIYNQKAKKVFWGTIAICILYTIIALIMLLGSYMSGKFKYVLLNRFFPFTVVFIIGTILLVSYLYYQVYNFLPIKINRANEYNVLSCPDYWKLEQVGIKYDIGSTNSNAFDSNIMTQLFDYRCVMDPTIFNKGIMAKQGKAINDKPYKITNTSIPNDTIGPATSIPSLNTYTNSLYIDSSNILNNSDFNKYSVEQNYPKNLLLHHNMIMNNYSYVNKPATYVKEGNNDTLTFKYKYNIPNASPNKYENDLKVYNLQFNSNNFNAATTNRIDVKLIKGVDNKITTEIKSGTTDEPTTPLANFPIVCDKLYPLYLATADKELNKIDPNNDENLNRCAFAKACNIPWSDLNCEKYDL